MGQRVIGLANGLKAYEEQALMCIKCTWLANPFNEGSFGLF